MYSFYQEPTYKKHEILQKYRQNKREKSILRNKLNIMQKTYEYNQRKAKSIETSIKKLNKIKKNYNKSREEVQAMMRKNQQIDEKKIIAIKQKKQQEKGKLPCIKQMIQREKSNQYIEMKRQRFDRERKLQIRQNSIISDRRRSASRIREEEKAVPFNRTLFMEFKKRQARKREETQSLLLQRKFKKSIAQMEKMKTLQSSLLYKLNDSRSKLSRSMSKVKTSLRA